MLNPKSYIEELHLHYEQPKVILRKTLIAITVIAVASFAVFGIDTAVTSIASIIG